MVIAKFVLAYSNLLTVRDDAGYYNAALKGIMGSVSVGEKPGAHLVENPFLM
jgi:hypothetical protein